MMGRGLGVVADPIAAEGHLPAHGGGILMKVPAGGTFVAKVGCQGLEVPAAVGVAGAGHVAPFDALVRYRMLGLQVVEIQFRPDPAGGHGTW